MKKDKKRRPESLHGLGIELFAGFVVALLMAWGIGALFSAPRIWRVVVGFVLGIGHNMLTLYRISKKF